jgi:nitrate reductase NapE
LSAHQNDKDHVLTRRGERRVFLFIAVFLFPILSIILVGGYGFLIWMTQLIFGPPGPG